MGPAQNYVSVPRRQPDIEDYIEMVRRYRSWIIGPMFLGLVAAVVVGFLWPDTYVSQATLRIVPQQVPEKLVPSALNTQIGERLNQMQQEILSRTGIEEIIRKPALDLYKKERSRLPMEDVVVLMRKNIDISPIGNQRGGRYASAFAIQFSYPDRYKAQSVVRELVARFTDSNIRVQKQQADTTTDFLTSELRQAKEKMDAANQAITRFTIENQGKLPQQESTNAQTLNMLQLQLMNIGQNLSSAQKDKAMLETQIDNNRNEQNSVTAMLEDVIPGSGPTAVRNEALISLQKDIADAQSHLASLNKQFGRNHPDVANQQAVVDSLERRRVDLELAAISRPAPKQGTQPVRVINPAMQKRLEDLKAAQKILLASISGKQTDIDTYIVQQRSVEKEIESYRKRLEESPLNAQQYAALLNDYTLKKQDYEDKLRRTNLSETSQNLEERKAGETLEQLDQASLPEQASQPNRPIWALVGTIGGLFLGLMLAAAKEVKDTSLKNLKDVRAYTNLPVLSSIPLLENALLVRRKRRLAWAAWSCSVVIGFALMGGAVYYHMTNL